MKPVPVIVNVDPTAPTTGVKDVMVVGITVKSDVDVIVLPTGDRYFPVVAPGGTVTEIEVAEADKIVAGMLLNVTSFPNISAREICTGNCDGSAYWTRCWSKASHRWQRDSIFFVARKNQQDQ